MTENDLTSRIAQADISQELKTALQELTLRVREILPGMPGSQRRRLERMLEVQLRDVTEPAAEAHFWEVGLDFIVKAAMQHESGGEAVLAAARQLRPLMQAALGPDEDVQLREITESTVYWVCMLSDTLTEPKKSMVAPNAISLAQAHFNKYAWFRAIYAGKAAVGFLMLYDNHDEAEYFLWRFMIAEPYQGRGYGRKAIERLVEYVKTRPNAKELGVSCGLGDGSPKEFYEKAGFVSTGEMDDGELVLKMQLEPAS